MKAFTGFTSLMLLFYFLRQWRKPALPTAGNGQSLLWEIKLRTAAKPSYIFGTMHLMCAEDAILSKNLLKVLKLVKQVYFEVDMDNAGSLLGGVTNFNMKDGAKLQDHLSLEEYEQVRQFFYEHQPLLPFEMLELQHPLMLSSSLYEFFLPCKEKHGIEAKIAAEAYSLRKITGGLETLAFQQQIFDSIPYSQQAKDLVKTINNLDHFKQSMLDMQQVYKSQDIDKLLQLTMEDDNGVNAHMDMLLYNRNRDWVSKMDKIMKQRSTLFAVGAGHLAGKSGVLNLLAKNGYLLRPILN